MALEKTVHPFQCRHSPDFPDLLKRLGCSLIISTYQAGKIIMVSPHEDSLIQLPRNFDTPMGMALKNDRLAIAARDHVVILKNQPSLGYSYPNQPNTYDSFYIPRVQYFCGYLLLHDLAWSDNELIGVNTRFSCLCKFGPDYSFEPIWKPNFISKSTPEDRCHLNGVAMSNGQAKYVTALGKSDEKEGWRENKLNGGILMDCESQEILLESLSMPHSPRIIDGKVYLLNSAKGELLLADLKKGKTEIICKLNGFARGMALCKDHLFIALSKFRHRHIFGDLPEIDKAQCGVTAIHLPTGAIVSEMVYENSCEEIYDLQIIQDQLRPGILGIDKDVHRLALSTPESSFWAKKEQQKS